MLFNYKMLINYTKLTWTFIILIMLNLKTGQPEQGLIGLLKILMEYIQVIRCFPLEKL